MKTLPLDHTTTASLHAILDYLESERESYEATPPAERHNHIYHAMINVSDWLDAFGG